MEGAAEGELLVDHERHRGLPLRLRDDLSFGGIRREAEPHPPLPQLRQVRDEHAACRLAVPDRQQEGRHLGLLAGLDDGLPSEAPVAWAVELDNVSRGREVAEQPGAVVAQDAVLGRADYGDLAHPTAEVLARAGVADLRQDRAAGRDPHRHREVDDAAGRDGGLQAPRHGGAEGLEGDDVASGREPVGGEAALVAHGIAGEARARQPGGRPDRDARRQLGLGEDAQAPPPHRAREQDRHAGARHPKDPQRYRLRPAGAARVRERLKRHRRGCESLA